MEIVVTHYTIPIPLGASVGAGGETLMSLARMDWSRSTVHEVIAEFLRAERHKFSESISSAEMELIDSPNVRDAQANHARLRHLYRIRAHLIGEIPPDTRWYEVRNLTDEELSDMHVIARCGWDHPSDKNELMRVASRLPKQLIKQPTAWERPILWGHEKGGPFTIIEGNNRLVAYASKGKQSTLAIPALVGLSSTPCFFHIFDPPNKIANDLWR
jgi:hypothetical protein